MATQGKERELIDLEKRFWDAMKSKDGTAAASMTEDGCIIVGAQGVSAIDRSMMERLTVEGAWDLQQYSFDEQSMRVRFIDDKTAIVGYKVKERIVVESDTLEFEANDASVWVRRDDVWRCTLHTESLAGDPFGRDRRR